LEPKRSRANSSNRGSGFFTARQGHPGIEVRFDTAARIFLIGDPIFRAG
jgi:hypothetical protein